MYSSSQLIERQEQALAIVENRIATAYPSDKVELEKVCIEGSTVALRILRNARTLRRRFTEGCNTYTDETQIPCVPFVDIIETAEGPGSRRHYIQRTRAQDDGGFGFHIDRVVPSGDGSVQVRLWETDGQPVLARFALARTIEDSRELVFDWGNRGARQACAETLPQSDLIRVQEHEIIAFLAEAEVDATTQEPVVLGAPHWFSCVGPVSYTRSCNTSVVDIPVA